MSKMDGGCLCGQIRYTASAEPAVTAVCHCADCQKQTGTAYSVLVGLPKDALAITGSPKIFETMGASGSRVSRLFCSDCGSPIVSYPDGIPGLCFVKAGTLDDTSWLTPTVEIWCSRAQPWVPLSSDTQKFDKGMR